MAFSLHPANGDTSRRRVGTTLSEINIIPLVDVILVLLLIFMLTAPLMHRGIDVNLPKSAGKPTAVEERVVITLSRDGVVYLNDKVVAGGALEGRLRDLYKDRADKTAYLKADQALQYGLVVETMDRVRRAGVEKLGMVTEPARDR
jgi:biopolymer transport protein TolR